jgi:transcriptional regulator
MTDARLYVPAANVLDLDLARALVAEVATAQLVTVAADGTPDATFLPIRWRDETVVGHLALANRHHRRIVDGSVALAIVTGPDAYVSPSAYPSKVEHGKVVPTWNYSVVQIRGVVRVIRDAEWLRALVTELTDTHESMREQPWEVTDAPADFIDGQLRAIVGVELTVTSVEAKAKLSQNRSDADRAGVRADLLARGDRDGDTKAAAVAAAMTDTEPG